MAEKYLMPMARNIETRQTVQGRHLEVRYTLDQRWIAEEMCQKLAEKMTRRTGDTWVGFVQEYTPNI
jgi:hypothetical protein